MILKENLMKNLDITTENGTNFNLETVGKCNYLGVTVVDNNNEEAKNMKRITEVAKISRGHYKKKTESKRRELEQNSGYLRH